MIQIIWAVIVAIILAVVLFILYRARKNERDDLVIFRQNSLEKLIDICNAEITEAIRDDDYRLVGDADYEAIARSKRKLALASRQCSHGIPWAVNLVKAAYRDVLEKELPTMDEVNEIYDFTTVAFLDSYVKWELLCYVLQKRLGNKRIIQYLEEKYEISAMRVVDDGINPSPKRCFDHRMLDEIVIQELSEDDITYATCIDVIVNIVFNKTKYLGVVGTIRDLDIDGFHFGTSGTTRYAVDGNWEAPYKDTNSVWVQVNAKWVPFTFLDFGSVGEMARVVNLISSWGHMAPMSEKVPIKVNDAQDGSRISVGRPPAGESWAAFTRKFSVAVRKMQWLMDKPQVHNYQLPRKLIYYLMRAEETTAFTGQQNTGKTTMMASAIADVNLVNIRVLEMSFELALREAYPDRDIWTVKNTDYVSAEELQDFLKKTDAYLSMVGEVATNTVAARMIQFCLVASAFTIFSHHGKDDNGLIGGLTNSLVACGEFENHDVAMDNVLDAIKNNVHLDFMTLPDDTVLRYTAYISEIHKEETQVGYPEMQALIKKARKALKNKDDKAFNTLFLAYCDLVREHYTRVTDRVRFTSHKIVVFNKETMSYEPNEWYSPEAMERFMRKLHGPDKYGFLQFYFENWRPNEPNPYQEYKQEVI